MRRIASVLALAGLLVSLSPLAASPAGARIVRRVVFSCNNCWPTAFTFTPDGERMFFVKRFSGEIRVKNLATGTNRLWARIGNVATTQGEVGLLGVALHPRWPEEDWVYVYFTQQDPFRNRIIRLRKTANGSLQREGLLRIPAAGFHNGGVIHFGPDGKLYAVTGDAGDPARSQDTASNAGKVLRLTRTGLVPGDNPFPGEYAFSFGHRNSFGFTFDPRTGRLWQTENGPTCDDEVNLARSGRNYGWGPSSACPNTSESGPDPIIQPEMVWTTPIAITGAVFCQGCRLGGRMGGRLLVGSWNDREILHLTLDAERNDVLSRRLLFDNPAGVLALERRPNGRVFFSEPNGIYRLVRV
jgi:glucose/arabinose dehydrogenase